MSRAVSVVLACVVAASCGDATGSSIPNVLHTYNATFRFVETDMQTFEAASEACPGTMSITEQNGRSFSGTFTIGYTGGASCVDKTGFVSGEISSNGRLTFSLALTGSSASWWEAMVSSCALKSGSSEFVGVIDRTKITASASATVRCGSKDFSMQTHVVAVMI